MFRSDDSGEVTRRPMPGDRVVFRHGDLLYEGRVVASIEPTTVMVQFADHASSDKPVRRWAIKNIDCRVV